jgi:hypothetical protein
MTIKINSKEKEKMEEKRYCPKCGKEMNEVFSFVFGCSFYFCPDRCGQIPNQANALVQAMAKKINKSEGFEK